MNVRTVSWFTGEILKVISILSVISLLPSLVFREWFGALALLTTGLCFFAVSILLKYLGSSGSLDSLTAISTAVLSWFLVGLIGSLPFLLVAWMTKFNIGILATPEMNETIQTFLNPFNGFFESFSGFTATGLTFAIAEEELPRTLQWWRSTTEWIGGVGVIVLTIAVLSRPGSGSLTLYNSEVGDKKIYPSIVSTVNEIWKIYIGLTFGAILLFVIVGMSPWGAINHAMAGMSTGGFSIYSDSIGHYDSALIEYAVIPVMIAGSIAFPVHYLIFKGELRNFYKDFQTRSFLIWLSTGSIAMFVIILYSNDYGSLEESFRTSLFQFISATTTAGFGTTTIGTSSKSVWSLSAIILMCLGMLTGGSAGSTASGIKIVRSYMLVKGTARELASSWKSRNRIDMFKIGDRSLDDKQFGSEYTEATVVLVLWIFTCVVSVFALSVVLPNSIPMENILFEVLSAESNVGLDAGIVGPSLPLSAKVVYIFVMFVGRLEIVPVAIVIGYILKPSD